MEKQRDLGTENEKIKQIAVEAKNRGIIFDIGHGTDSFNFQVAETAYHQGIKADTISTDIYIRNRKNGPVYDLATTMEKLRLVGYTWEEIIEKVTEVPAQNFHLKTKGQIKEGFDADFTVFELIFYRCPSIIAQNGRLSGCPGSRCSF